MANTCAYRADATDAAAKALYIAWMGGGDQAEERWESSEDYVKDDWRDIFRAGHRAYRRVIQEENRQRDRAAQKNSEVAP